MAQFLGDIAFALWTALFAGGLILWHIGSKEAAGLVKFAAAITVGISIAGAMCTGYFWFKYEGAGAFENAYPTMKHMEAMEGMAMGGMMKGQMPMGGKRQESMTNEGMMPGAVPTERVPTDSEREAQPKANEWEEHHNEHSESY
tara:strand:- start:3694 stop:4125 length:432 start_codon:yes stop_codon:yes gene_type:complete